MTRRVGRPSKLTEETKNKLMQALIASCSISDACAYAEISDAAYYKWQERAREHKAAGRKSEYVEFFEEIARARAKAKPRLIMLLSKAAERDPRTALAILERRYPKEWGVRQYVETRDRTGDGAKGGRSSARSRSRRSAGAQGKLLKRLRN